LRNLEKKQSFRAYNPEEEEKETSIERDTSFSTIENERAIYENVKLSQAALPLTKVEEPCNPYRSIGMINVQDRTTGTNSPKQV